MRYSLHERKSGRPRRYRKRHDLHDSKPLHTPTFTAGSWSQIRYPFSLSVGERWMMSLPVCRCLSVDYFARSANPAVVGMCMLPSAQREARAHNPTSKLWKAITNNDPRTSSRLFCASCFPRCCHLLERSPETFLGDQLPQFQMKRINIRTIVEVI